MQVRVLGIKPPPDAPRSGLHLSSCIKHILKGQDPDKYGTDADDEVRWLWELGLGWEYRVLQHPRFKGHDLVYQLSRKKDGITGTLDIADKCCKTVVEAKLTEMSSRDAFTSEKFRGWRWQGMGYCKLTGWVRVLYPCFHLRGDYGQVRREVRWVEVVYSREEIEKNWRMLLNAKEDLVEGQAPKKVQAEKAWNDRWGK